MTRAKQVNINTAIHTRSCPRCNEKLTRYETDLCNDCLADELTERELAKRLLNNSSTPEWYDDYGPGEPQGC